MDANTKVTLFVVPQGITCLICLVLSYIVSGNICHNVVGTTDLNPCIQRHLDDPVWQLGAKLGAIGFILFITSILTFFFMGRIKASEPNATPKNG